MKAVLSHLVRLLAARLGLLLVAGDEHDRRSLALRRQILVLQRQINRPRFTPADRTGLGRAMLIVQPQRHPAHALIATDFFCVDTVGLRGLHVLFFIELDTARTSGQAI